MQTGGPLCQIFRQSKAIYNCGSSGWKSLWVGDINPIELSSAKDDLYYLEQAARVQVLAMSTHLPLALVDEEVCKVTKFLVRAVNAHHPANW